MSFKVIKITKSFRKKYVKDYQAVEVGTEITAEVDISTQEELKEVSDKIAKQVRVTSIKDYRAFKQAQEEGKID